LKIPEGGKSENPQQTTMILFKKTQKIFSLKKKEIPENANKA